MASPALLRPSRYKRECWKQPLSLIVLEMVVFGGQFGQICYMFGEPTRTLKEVVARRRVSAAVGTDCELFFPRNDACHEGCPMWDALYRRGVGAGVGSDWAAP